MITPLGNTYTVQLLTPFGVPLDYIKIVSLDYSRAEGTVGQLTLSGSINYWGEISEYYLIKVFRGIGGDKATVLDLETVWIITRVKAALSSNGERLLSLVAKDGLMVLEDRIVAYYATTTLSSSNMTGLAGNLMKAIVRQNVSSTANDYSNGASVSVGNLPARGIPSKYFAVSDNTGEGANVSMQFAWQKVLTVLNSIKNATATAGSPVLFDVVAGGGSLLEFRTYKDIRGTDHTYGDTILLDPQLNNLGETSLSIDVMDETTFIYCGGQDQNTARVLKTSYDTGRINMSPFARREAFQDARNAEDPTSVQSTADAALRSSKGKVVFESVVLEAPNNRYGIEYDFGARLPCSFMGRRFICTLDKIQVSVSQHYEKITAKLQSVV